MHKRFRVLIPTGQEVVAYLIVSVLALLLFNGPNIWRALLASNHTDSQTADFLSSGIHNHVNNLTGSVNGQLVNAVVWGGTALIAFLLTLALASFLKATIHDGKSIERIVNKSRIAKPSVGLPRFGVRLASLLSLVIWTVVFIGKFLPWLLDTFLRHTTHPLQPWYGTIVILLTVFLLAVSGWIYALLLRLLVLRIRVLTA